jgi:hypothetical protein
MGSLTSRPKAAPAPQVVYVPAPTSPLPADSGSVDPAQPPQKTASEIRASSLLGRDRSRFGTILTGFRGLLDLANTSSKRKTLLGE